MTATVTARLRPARTVSEGANGRRSHRLRARIVLAILAILSPVVIVLAIGLGAVWIPPNQVWTVLAHHVVNTSLGAVSPIDDHIVWQTRVPRVLMAAVAGAALAAAGTVLQAVLRNPLADPYVLGVASGASVGAAAVLTVGLGTTGITGAAFAGAMLALIGVVMLGRRGGSIDPTRVLLAGVALTYLLQAVTSYLQLRASPDQAARVLFWLLGSVAGASWKQLVLPVAVAVIGLAVVLSRVRVLNALLLGDDTAHSLGVSVSRSRLVLLVVTALLTAVVVSVAGGIGFVGLVAPHCARLIVGPDHRALLPTATVLGGLFLVLADLVGRTAAQPLELPLSIVTAVVGVPFFVLLLRRSRAGA